MINIDRCINAKRNDTTWLCMSNIDIAHYGQMRIIDYIYQYLLIFLLISTIHRFAYKDTLNHIKNAGFF